MNVDERLDQAMQLFWEKGYFDTSVEDLGARTGLNRAAIYGEFGNKKKLFEALLGRYQEKVTARRLVPLLEPEAGLSQIEQFFRQFRNFGARGESRLGCLMCLTAAEVSPHVGSVARIVTSFLEELTRLFRRALVTARKRGEVRPGTDATRLANYLTGSVLGLMALIRSPAPRAAISDYVAGVLSLLRNLQPPRERGRPPS
jgi:TetR/AcrR family transcriptional repressor of nem operon